MNNEKMNLISPLKLFTESWKFFKSKFALFASISFIIFLASCIESIVTAPEVITQMQSTTFSILSFVGGILCYCILLLSSLALIIVVSGSDEMNASIAYQKAFRLFFPYIWVAILVFFTVVTGFFALIIPGLILIVYLTFSSYVVVIENIRGKKALIKSFKYVSGNFWQVTIRIVVIGLLFMIINLMVMSLIFPISYTIMGGKVAPQTIQQLLTSSVVTSALSAFLIVPFGIIYSYLLYLGLKVIAPAEVSEKRERVLNVGIIILSIVGIVLFVAVASLVLFVITHTNLEPFKTLFSHTL